VTDVLDVVVNGEERTFGAGATVESVLARHAAAHAGVAVAVNGEVVPKSEWSTHSLAAGDRVEILTAAQGG
jgi:sulfur carrier protein